MTGVTIDLTDISYYVMYWTRRCELCNACL